MICSEVIIKLHDVPLALANLNSLQSEPVDTSAFFVLMSALAHEPVDTSAFFVLMSALAHEPVDTSAFFVLMSALVLCHDR